MSSVSPSQSLNPSAQARAYIDAGPSTASKDVVEVPAQSVAPPLSEPTPGLLRGLTEPVRRLIPGHKGRHDVRKNIHTLVFQALEASRGEFGGSDGWKRVIDVCRRAEVDLAHQLDRCSSPEQHVLDALLATEDYESLARLGRSRQLPERRYGRVWVSNYSVGETTLVDGEQRLHGKGVRWDNAGRYSTMDMGQWHEGRLVSGERRKGREGGEQWVYRGNFLDGRCHGQGDAFHLGNHIQGEWVYGTLEGRVSITLKYGKITGTYVKGKLTDATLTYSDGRVYTGALDPDYFCPMGQGTMTYTNGGVYQGRFDNGSRQGDGRYTYGPEERLAGHRCIGTWERDKIDGVGGLEKVGQEGDRTLCFHRRGEFLGTGAPWR